MSGFFGIVSKRPCITDLFYGIDYHSHLGTSVGGICTFDGNTFHRSIHSLKGSYFRTKFDDELPKFLGNSGIGVISDTDAQPIVVNSHLGKFAIVTVAKITNIKELEQECLDNKQHFAELSHGDTNPTELVALLITQGNPNLINTHIHSAQVFASFPISLSVRFGYNYLIDPIYRELYQNAENLDLGESRYRNGDHTQNFFGSISWNGNVTKWWYLYSSVYFGRNYYEKEEDGILKQNNRNFAMFNVGNMLTLPYGVKFNLNFYYGTPYPSEGVTVKELWDLSASLEKSFLNNNLTVRLSANNIFNTMLYWQQSILRGNSLVFYDGDERNIMLNVTYKFGDLIQDRLVRRREIGYEK